jgi:hypothetical protein
MPITQDQVTKEIDLQLPDILPESVASEIKRDVGDYVTVAILDYVGQGQSPVQGGKKFKQLSKEYADEEKGGRREPNLELNGDMLGSLTYKATDKGVEVGIFDSSQAPKAYNHCVGDTLPKRQFIPDKSQSFVGEIEKGIRELVNKRIMESALGEFEPRPQPRSTPSDNRQTQEILKDIKKNDVSVSTQTTRAPTAFSFFGTGTLSQTIKDILSGE